MKTLRNLSFALVVCLSASWLGAQSNAAVSGSQPDAMTVQAQPGNSVAPVKAIVTDGQTGEIIPDSTLTFTTIEIPGAAYTGVYGINTAGDMVGAYQATFSSPTHAFLLRGGQFSTFHYPGGYDTLPFGINDSGLIVGYAQYGYHGPWAGFEYDGTTFTTIRDGKDIFTVCHGINNAGWVVGGDGAETVTQGFELRGHTFEPIIPPGTYAPIYATGINKSGEVVGYNDGVSSDYVGFSYINGKYATIEFPGIPATTTEPWGINDSGVVVGWYNPMSAYIYGFVLSKGEYISFSYPGAVQTAAYGINASGQIVGTYSWDNVTYHGFVTSPLTSADFPPDE